MGKVAIIGALEIAPGRIDEVLPILMAHRERCLRDEPGTLQFEILRPRDEVDKVLIYEVYRDGAAFTAHWEGASMAVARKEADGIILMISGTWCTLQE